MPIVFAFCRTAPSVRFIAFATSTTGVLVFEWALSCRRSSLVHGFRTRSLLFWHGFRSSLEGTRSITPCRSLRRPLPRPRGKGSNMGQFSVEKPVAPGSALSGNQQTYNSIRSAISSRGKSTSRDALLPWPSGALSPHRSPLARSRSHCMSTIPCYFDRPSKRRCVDPLDASAEDRFGDP